MRLGFASAILRTRGVDQTRLAQTKRARFRWLSRGTVKSGRLIKDRDRRTGASEVQRAGGRVCGFAFARFSKPKISLSVERTSVVSLVSTFRYVSMLLRKL